jgi:hypothetical protein
MIACNLSNSFGGAEPYFSKSPQVLAMTAYKGEVKVEVRVTRQPLSRQYVAKRKRNAVQCPTPAASVDQSRTSPWCYKGCERPPLNSFSQLGACSCGTNNTGCKFLRRHETRCCKSQTPGACLYTFLSPGGWLQVGYALRRMTFVCCATLTMTKCISPETGATSQPAPVDKYRLSLGSKSFCTHYPYSETSSVLLQEPTVHHGRIELLTKWSPRYALERSQQYALQD